MFFVLDLLHGFVCCYYHALTTTMIVTVIAVTLLPPTCKIICSSRFVQRIPESRIINNTPTLEKSSKHTVNRNPKPPETRKVS